MPVRTFALCLALTATAVAQEAPSEAPPPGIGQAGDVVVEVNGALAPVGAGARVYLAEGLALGAALDRSVFADVDPTVRASPLILSNAIATTLVASLEWDVAASARVRLGYGAQAYAQHQRSDVAVGTRPRLDPVVAGGARRSEALGVAYMMRVEARVGPLRLGGVGAPFGLAVQRTVGGTREDGRTVRMATPADERWRGAFSRGSTRFYVGIAL